MRNAGPILCSAARTPGKGRTLFPLCEGVALRTPVVQAPLGPCDGPLLAAAVSRAGALGTLTVRAPNPTKLAADLRRIRARTTRPVLLALNAEWEPESVLTTALENGFRHFGLFWWNGSRLSRRIHEGGGKVFWQVGTLEQASDALDSGADVVIAQGTGAGGQVRSPHPIREFLPQLVELCRGRQVPIVAGGGLATRADVAEMLAGGAAAAMLGTRFLVSDEALSSFSDKVSLARATSADLTLDPNLVGDWPCAPRRRLVLASGADRASLFAGSGIDRIRAILPAARIVRSLIP